MAGALQLVAGLGNTGSDYAETRHNAGFWFVDALAADCGARFKREAKFGAEAARIEIAGQVLWLLKPLGYMNLSGAPVAAAARYYQIDAAALLVAHDELDLPPGVVRLKCGGGHGGHNGLRDLTRHLGGSDFVRLRIGIGRPAPGADVTGYVLSRPPQEQRERIAAAIARAREQMPDIVAGRHARAMNVLHAGDEPGSGAGAPQDG